MTQSLSDIRPLRMDWCTNDRTGRSAKFLDDIPVVYTSGFTDNCHQQLGSMYYSHANHGGDGEGFCLAHPVVARRDELIS